MCAYAGNSIPDIQNGLKFYAKVHNEKNNTNLYSDYSKYISTHRKFYRGHAPLLKNNIWDLWVLCVHTL